MGSERSGLDDSQTTRHAACEARGLGAQALLGPTRPARGEKDEAPLRDGDEAIKRG